jgi:hypothetical protein
MTRRLLVLVLLAAVPAAAQEGFIPPRAARELGIPADTLRRVQDLAYAANDEAVELEAAVRRAQMALDRELRSSQPPDEARALERIEALTKAQGAMRRNRILLLVRVRRTLGEELWQRLEAWRAENGPPRREEGGRPFDLGPRPGAPGRRLPGGG